MTAPRKLAVLGATGSIGCSALSLAWSFRDRLQVTALAGHRNVGLLAEAVRRFRPAAAAVAGEVERRALAELLSDLRRPPEILIGPEGLVSAAVDFGAETVVSAVTGAAGLPPTWAAVVGGLTVALANKESLVLAGELVMPLAGERLRPVDSEHSAVFQALGGVLRRPDLRRLILTASGGPFRGWSSARLAAVGPREALRHPTWSMGPKISCDSATLMNKGLE
ncbi:MAG: 1-deoxy-D-xylulose-5-phosphate reductoisomerase, partial [Deltaproteobacteria bacterium]|nr:1-deoxy-D-xylulose-5-phosphate reductoisomerase [Deltaproteobacteria bacterium]